MYDVWPFRWSDEIVQVSNEGDDWMGAVRYTKVRPASVVELFDQTRRGIPSCYLERPYSEVGQLLNFNWTD